MRGPQRRRTESSGAEPIAVLDDAEFDDEFGEPPDSDADDADFRHVDCPSCRRAIAVREHAVRLPAHAVCATPWNPFGADLCPGSGADVRAALPRRADDERPPLLRGLPPNLDWRTQPFSHAGRAVPRRRLPAA